MVISEKKMKAVIDNYFKKECDVNTSIRQAFEKGFCVGVEKATPKRGEWIDYECGSGCYCSNCGWDGDDIIDECIIQDFDFCPNCGADMRKESE